MGHLMECLTAFHSLLTITFESIKVSFGLDPVQITNYINTQIWYSLNVFFSYFFSIINKRYLFKPQLPCFQLKDKIFTYFVFPKVVITLNPQNKSYKYKRHLYIDFYICSCFTKHTFWPFVQLSGHLIHTIQC